VNVVNVSGLEPGFFITVALFILFILCMLGMGVLSLFQLKRRNGLLYFAAGIVGIIAFAIVLNINYM
jgi:Tfp pilus assembly protein PilX